MVAERQPLWVRVATLESTHFQLGQTPDSATWTSDVWFIAKHSLPLMPIYLLRYDLQLTVIIAASQLSIMKLARVALGIMTSNIIGFAIFEGIATALDTLRAQVLVSRSRSGCLALE